MVPRQTQDSQTQERQTEGRKHKVKLTAKNYVNLGLVRHRFYQSPAFFY